jgi:hypothetical protein
MGNQSTHATVDDDDIEDLQDDSVSASLSHLQTTLSQMRGNPI